MAGERKSRAQRREEARAVAKEILRSEKNEPRVTRLDAGWYLAACMALGLFLAAPKIGRGISAAVLIAMFLCLVRPIWRFGVIQNAMSNSDRNWRFIGIVLVAAVSVALFGLYVWPPIKRHMLAAKEQASFENVLKPLNGGDLEVQIACPQDDEKTCTYAQQFINLVGKSGWNVEPYVTRTTLTRALDGITVYRRAGNREYSLKHWDAGGYLEINEPHLLAVQSAFHLIDIELQSGTDPDLPENVMMIYFGPESEDEAEPTNLTRSIEWVTGKHEGPFPTQQ